MTETTDATVTAPRRVLSDVQKANLAKGREALVARRAADKAARERGEEVPVRPRKKKATLVDKLATSSGAVLKTGADGIFEFLGKLERMSEPQRASLYKLPFGL